MLRNLNPVIKHICGFLLFLSGIALVLCFLTWLMGPTAFDPVKKVRHHYSPAKRISVTGRSR
jgi:cytochrome b subunit of formate dehydrogenase